MPKISIIIPNRNELFAQKTIEDILIKAKGDIEIIMVLDGFWPDPQIPDYKRVTFFHKGKTQGMRAAINSGVAIAKGDYIMKLDGHCMLDEGFDLKLLADMQDDWIVVPRRKRLDAEKWEVQDVGKPDVDYEYLSFPDNPSDFGGPGLNGRIWTQRILERKDILIDETPASQGSAWFMKKDYFNKLGLMDDQKWGPFWCESQELAFRSILTGGKYMVNKKTWYAHLHKGKKYGRGYNMKNGWLTQGRNMAMRFFAGERVWEDQKYPLSYLIEKFMPMPGWTQEEINKLKKREWKK
jgi:glycosyltransferase involved in cell wall biosynthesis